MMHDMMSGMMGSMGLISILVVVVLALGAAVLIKYLFFSDRGD
jgi:flagellar basal body-associated protein FliL